MALLQQPESDALARACGENPSFLCDWTFDLTGSERWASAVDSLLATPAKIGLILVVAVMANYMVRRAIRRFAGRIANPEAHARLRRRFRRRPSAGVIDTGVLSLRSAARADTLTQVLRSVATAGIWAIAVTMILGEIGVNLGPLIAGAGIAGVAIGFGAQSLVKDFLSGLFMLVEDQYGVGDVIDAGEATGVVEAVTLRTTKLRDLEGTVWHIPNGQIARVGNKSQQWARALVDVNVAYRTDIDEAQAVIKRVADELCRSTQWRTKVIGQPEIWGVEALGPDAVAIRLVVKTKPGEQFDFMRALRRRLVEAMKSAGIEIPFPQRSIWVRRDQGSSLDAEGPLDEDTFAVPEPRAGAARPQPGDAGD